MSKLILNRRRFLTASAAGATGLVLAGCDQFDFLKQGDHPVRNVLEGANDLTRVTQRALIGQHALAREYSESEMTRQPHQRVNGSRDPQSEEYLALKAGDFADYRFRIIGLVDRELSFSLNELRNMPARTQITRHDCVEGWSCIAKWSGTQLGPILDMAGVKPGANYLMFHCYDTMDGGLSGQIPYYESCDLVDAHHPQTILAYRLNDGALPVGNGAPVRIRIERALGYKQPKFVHTVELVEDYRTFKTFGRGHGGYWEDVGGYDWYAGI